MRDRDGKIRWGAWCALVLGALTAGGCGDDDGGTAPDAAPSVDAAAAIDAAPVADATPTIDGSVARCQASGDYVESDEIGNATLPEPTGLSIGPGGASSTIGGCVATDQSIDNAADLDLYEFTVTETTNVRVDLTWSEDTTPMHWLVIYDDTDTEVAWWTPGNTGAVSSRPTSLLAGTYWIYLHVNPPAPETAYAYQLAIAEEAAPCAQSAADPDYTEADESGAGHRANDMAEIVWTEPVTITATAADDAPEATGLTLAAGSDYRVLGTSANVGASSDDYLDHDTFAVTTGDSTTRLHVRLDWQSNPTDMDFMVFRADDVGAVVAGGVTYERQLEYAVVSVEPNATYWVWVAVSADASAQVPRDYALTICAR